MSVSSHSQAPIHCWWRSCRLWLTMTSQIWPSSVVFGKKLLLLTRSFELFQHFMFMGGKNACIKVRFSHQVTKQQIWHVHLENVIICKYHSCSNKWPSWIGSVHMRPLPYQTALWQISVGERQGMRFIRGSEASDALESIMRYRADEEIEVINKFKGWW